MRDAWRCLGAQATDGHVEGRYRKGDFGEDADAGMCLESC